VHGVGLLMRGRGFSLIEVVIVLAVLAALAALMVPLLITVANVSKSNVATGDAQGLYRAILGDQKQTFGYYGDVGDYPASLQDLVRPPAGPPAGWKGPYLELSPDPSKSNQITDAFGNAFEYFLVKNSPANTTPDTLAIISRGPDGASSNSSATPNTASDFSSTAPAPTVNTYLSTLVGSAPVNQDNIVFPNLDSANNASLLRVFTAGTYAPIIKNADANPVVNAVVTGCPALYTLKTTSLPRGSADVRTDSWTPDLPTPWATDLEQGVWRVDVTTSVGTAAVFSQVITVLPNSVLTPTITPSSIYSTVSATATLNINNQSGVAVRVMESGGTNRGNIASGSLTTCPSTNCLQILTTIHQCAPIQIQNNTSPNALIDQFTMPAVTYTRFIYAVGSADLTRTLTVTNSSVAPRVKVFANGVQIGSVLNRRSNTYTVRTNDSITVQNNAGTTMAGTPTAMPAGPKTLTCSGSSCS
jgi:prepilin-type N-terminal cleavage/methylation domain-containing protein